MLYKNYLRKIEKKKSSKSNSSSPKRSTNEETYRDIRSRVELEFSDTFTREVVTIRKIGIVYYRFKIVRVTKFEFVLYKNEDILSDANSLNKTLTVMFEAINLH